MMYNDQESGFNTGSERTDASTMADNINISNARRRHKSGNVGNVAPSRSRTPRSYTPGGWVCAWLVSLWVGVFFRFKPLFSVVLRCELLALRYCNFSVLS